MHRFTGFIPFVLLATACGGAGTGKGVRTDVTTQMASAEGPISECYKTALTRSRRFAGDVVVSFRIEPKTGKFKEVRVAHSEINDAELQQCIIAEVGKLVLAKPQKTTVGIDTYPIRFSPSN